MSCMRTLVVNGLTLVPNATNVSKPSCYRGSDLFLFYGISRPLLKPSLTHLSEQGFIVPSSQKSILEKKLKRVLGLATKKIKIQELELPLQACLPCPLAMMPVSCHQYSVLANSTLIKEAAPPMFNLSNLIRSLLKQS